MRKFLFSQGFRFRKNDKRYPGKPDVVLPKYNTMIFINGCFWHQHEGCKYASRPKKNVDYWEAKFARNKARDAEVRAAMQADGWHVIEIWECELKKDKIEETRKRLQAEIRYAFVDLD